MVAVTHDPKLDDMALLEALKSPAFYVGALGSRGNTAKRKERLTLFDLSAEEIGRLHGPVGLDLGARTPAEIAVSILAEIIAVRSGVALRRRRRDLRCQSVQRQFPPDSASGDAGGRIARRPRGWRSALRVSSTNLRTRRMSVGAHVKD